VRDAGAAAAVLSQQRRYGARNLAIKASINQALVAERPLQSSAFAAHWGRPGERLPQQALQAESLLNAWQRWWQQGGPAPAAQQEQLISAFVHLAWQTLHTPATATPAAELLESLAASWFAEGRAGLQPRLRLLRRPLARGRLPGTEPSLAAVEQLAILSDLLAWAEAESALVPALLAWPWLERFRSWRDALADQLQQLLHPAWLGPRAEDQQRLQLVLALLQRHRQRPAEPVDALLRLLSALQGDTPVPPARRALILALAQQHGLLDPGLGAALGAAAEPGLPIPGLVAFPGLGPR
jgi:hypothetical protein